MATARHFLLVLASLQSFASSAQYKYVDGASGSDANDGLSVTTAWATIQKAFDSSVWGDSVFIRGGTYVEHPVLNVSNVYFRNFPGEQVFIDGDPSLGSTIITIEGHYHITIKGLTIQGLITAGAIGILIWGGEQGMVQNVLLDSIEVTGIGWTDDAAAIPGPDDNAQPIVVLGEVNAVFNPQVRNSRVHNNITGYSEAIAFDGFVSNFDVIGCEVFDNTNIGICAGGNYDVFATPELDHSNYGRIMDNHCWNNVSPYATSAGIYVDGGWNTTIERNVCEGNGYGIEIGCEENGTTENIQVLDNVVRFNHGAGLAIGGYTEATTGQVLGCSVRNNTFFSNDMDGTGSGELYITKASDCEFYNNVFHTSEQNILLTREDISPQSGNALDYNGWYVPSGHAVDTESDWGGTTITGFSDYQTTSGWDAHGFFADPLFVDVASDPPDLTLQWNSPCIDVSDPSTFILPGEQDAAGLPRLNGPLVDLGAYEYQNFLAIPASDMDHLLFTPNPFSEGLQLIEPSIGSRLELLDMSGRVMMSDLVPMDGAVDTRCLSSDMYVARLTSTSGSVLFQCVIKR